MQPELKEQIWPERLHAPIAALENHFRLFENEAVRVFDMRVGTGPTVALFTHRWPSALYIAS
jgi:trans-aconitate methyltransferase